MLAFSSTYTGTGVSGLAVTGVGFTPDVVIIKAGLDSSSDTWFRTKDMAAGIAAPVRGDLAPQTNRITSLDTDGFTLGSDNATNQSGYTIYYLALKDDGSGDFSTISFLGDATDDRLVFSTFKPDYALLKTSQAIVGAHKFADQASSLANQSSNIAYPNYQGAGSRSDLIAFLSGGMYVSDGSNSGGNLVNQSALQTYGFVLKASANIQIGTYVGNGTSTSVTTTFQPIFVVTDNQYAVTAYSAEFGSGLAQYWDFAPQTGMISGVTSTSFSLGSSANTNTNGTTYSYMAIGAKAASAGPSTRKTLAMMGIGV